VETAERIIEVLSEHQHLQPHRPVGDTLATVAGQLGICPGAVSHAARSLALDPHRKVGRLQRCELLQIARTIHRYWRQSVVEYPAPSQQV
jgi:hypothetical protein